MRIKVLGCGNLLAYDEGVGIHAVRILKEDILPKDVDISELKKPGLFLLDLIKGSDVLIIIDALAEEKTSPGTVHRFELNFENCYEKLEKTIHGFNLIPAINKGKKVFPEGLPKKIILYAMEIEERSTFRTGLSPRVREGLDYLLDMIWHEISQNQTIT